MTRRTLYKIMPIAAFASIVFVLTGCESTQTGNPERMQKSLDSQRKAMGTPGQPPTGPGAPGGTGGQAPTTPSSTTG